MINMTKARIAVATGALLVLGLGAAPAMAIPLSTVGNCQVTDVTADGVAANSCYGLVSGNVSESGTYGYENVIPDAAFGGAFAGNNWTVKAVNFDIGTHTWSGNVSGWQELIIVLKQSILWGAWYFNPADSPGTWSTAWDYPNGNDGQGGGLSHGFALVRGPTSVPEPTTVALFGLGLLGMGFAARRKTKSN